MPVELNDTLDEPLAYDRQEAFLQQRSFGRANLLGQTEAVELKNTSPDSSGVIRNRRGFHWLADVGSTGTVQGGGFFNGSTDYTFAVRNGTLYIFTSGYGTPTSVALTGASTTAKVYWCQVADNIYLSTGNAGEVIHEVDAATPSRTADASGVTALKYLTAQSYRVFCVKEPDLVYVSDILPSAASGLFAATTAATTSLYFRVGQDQDPITGLYAWQDTGLLIFKGDSIWLADVNPAAIVTANAANAITGIGLRQISNKVGCVSHHTCQQVGNDAFFLARDGVRSIGRIIADGMAATNEPLSVPIQDLVERINWSAAGTSIAVYRERKYMLAVPLDAATQPNTVLVFDTTVKGWSYWTGIEPVDFIVENFSELKLAAVDVNAKIIDYRDHVDEANIVRSDYADFLNSEEAGISSWANDNGYIQIATSSLELSVGDQILFKQFINNTANDTAVEGNVYDVTAVTGTGPWTATTSALVSSLTTTTPTATMDIDIIKGVRPAWSIKSRALVFGQALNPKVIDHVELEFDRDSDAVCDLDVVLDDSDPVAVEEGFSSGGGDGVVLPVVLPFTLPRGKVNRKRISLYGEQEQAREVQFNLSEASTLSGGQRFQSRVVSLRSITAAGFVEEFEDIE